MNKKPAYSTPQKETKPFFFYLLILIVCFSLYGISVKNDFNIDDDYVYENHPLVQQGIKGIPEIFTSRYNTRDEQYFGYRPLTIAIYAVEYEFFGSNPTSAHFLNIMYYAGCCWLLFSLLCILFKSKYPQNYLWLGFLITLIFATHAIHTEVVLSIKNREEIICLIFGLASTILSIKFFTSKHKILIIPAIISLALAFLAKESAIVFLALIPLTIVFYNTDIKLLPDFKFNLDVIKKINKTEAILFILLIVWMIFYLLCGPALIIYGNTKIILHNINAHINVAIPWLLFLITYLFILMYRKKHDSGIKSSLRNIVIWSIILVLVLITIIFYSSFSLFITFFFFLVTLIPEKTDIKSLIKIKLFENASIKFLFPILALIAISTIVLAIAYYIPKQALPEINAPVYKWQNPSFDPGSTIFDKIAVALYSMIYYVKLLLIPYPLRFYYGYKMIPDVSIFNPIVLLSLAFHLYLLFVAFSGFNKRKSLSFGILFYLIAIFPFANTFFPLTGIIAERMLFTPSIGFAIAIVFLLFKLTKTDLSLKIVKSKKHLTVVLLAILILPNMLITFGRNADWKDRKTLYTHDIEYLENSAKANTLYGNLLIGEVFDAVKRNQSIEPLRSQVELATKYFNRATEIDSTYSNPWHSLGYINMILYKNYPLAEQQFTNCLRVDSTIAAAYLNRGITNYYLKKYKQSITDFEDYVNKNKNYKDKEYDKAYLFSAKSYLELGDTIKSTKFYVLAKDNLKKQNLNAAVIDDIKKYFILVKDYKNAISISDLEISFDPNKDLPYVEKGNYYFLSGDTVSAIQNWEIAFEKFNGNFNIAMTLSDYFRKKGNTEKANYYSQKAVNYRNSHPNESH